MNLIETRKSSSQRGGAAAAIAITVSFALLFAFLGSCRSAGAQTPLNTAPPPKGYSQTAADLTSACVTTFWNRTGGNIFSNAVPSAETVSSDAAHNNGYTLWPSLIGLHSLVEAEKQRPGGYNYWIWTVYSGLNQYWNPTWHCYMAWLMFPGNQQAFYDDNAWAVIILVEAYNATRTTDPTHASVYLSRANDIMSTFEVFGWQNDTGGMKWCTDSTVSGATDRTASATAGAALAAFVLGEAGQAPTFGGTWLSWGTGALSWVQSRLEAPDNLVMDGIHADGTLMPTKWTYNTGVTMRAFVEHYRLGGSSNDLTSADNMAYAALNRNGALFDSIPTDTSKRCWYDSTFFAHYLVDGLMQTKHVTRDTTLQADIDAEVTREANYIYNYVRDSISGDNMYWRNLRLWRIGPYQDQVWENLTGQTFGLQQDPAEMSNDGSIYVKTLLSNASVARLFWLTAEL